VGEHVIVLSPTQDESEVHRFYQTIDVLTHCSKIGEAFGNTLNEAMYWKRPVIINSTPRKDNGQLEQIDHMQTGIIANFPQSFAHAVVYLYDRPEERKRMGENGRAKVTTQYSPERVTRQLEKACVELLVKKDIPVSKEIQDVYASIAYDPSKEAILSYKDTYKKRLRESFGALRGIGYAVNMLRMPKKIFWKGKDFLEDKGIL